MAYCAWLMRFCLTARIAGRKWERLDACIAFWGIGRHIGSAASNNQKGDMIGHVIDQGKSFDDPDFRAYQTKDDLDYHNDQTDAVALLCLKTAKIGGQSKIASVGSVYNEMLIRRRDLVEELCKPMWVSRNNEIGPDQKPWYEIPVFNFKENHYPFARAPNILKKATISLERRHLLKFKLRPWRCSINCLKN